MNASKGLFTRGKKKAESCDHWMPDYDCHRWCRYCRITGRGSDLCAEAGTAQCSLCQDLSEKEGDHFNNTPLSAQINTKDEGSMDIDTAGYISGRNASWCNVNQRSSASETRSLIKYDDDNDKSNQEKIINSKSSRYSPILPPADDDNDNCTTENDEWGTGGMTKTSRHSQIFPPADKGYPLLTQKNRPDRSSIARRKETIKLTTKTKFKHNTTLVSKSSYKSQSVYEQMSNNDIRSTMRAVKDDINDIEENMQGQPHPVAAPNVKDTLDHKKLIEIFTDCRAAGMGEDLAIAILKKQTGMNFPIPSVQNVKNTSIFSQGRDSRDSSQRHRMQNNFDRLRPSQNRDRHDSRKQSHNGDSYDNYQSRSKSFNRKRKRSLSPQPGYRSKPNTPYSVTSSRNDKHRNHLNQLQHHPAKKYSRSYDKQRSPNSRNSLSAERNICKPSLNASHSMNRYKDGDRDSQKYRSLNREGHDYQPVRKHEYHKPPRRTTESGHTSSRNTKYKMEDPYQLRADSLSSRLCINYSPEKSDSEKRKYQPSKGFSESKHIRCAKSSKRDDIISESNHTNSLSSNDSDDKLEQELYESCLEKPCKDDNVDADVDISLFASDNEDFEKLDNLKAQEATTTIEVKSVQSSDSNVTEHDKTETLTDEVVIEDDKTEISSDIDVTEDDEAETLSHEDETGDDKTKTTIDKNVIEDKAETSSDKDVTNDGQAETSINKDVTEEDKAKTSRDLLLFFAQLDIDEETARPEYLNVVNEVSEDDKAVTSSDKDVTVDDKTDISIDKDVTEDDRADPSNNLSLNDLLAQLDSDEETNMPEYLNVDNDVTDDDKAVTSSAKVVTEDDKTKTLIDTDVTEDTNIRENDNSVPSHSKHIASDEKVVPSNSNNIILIEQTEPFEIDTIVTTDDKTDPSNQENITQDIILITSDEEDEKSIPLDKKSEDFNECNISTSENSDIQTEEILLPIEEGKTLINSLLPYHLTLPSTSSTTLDAMSCKESFMTKRAEEVSECTSGNYRVPYEGYSMENCKNEQMYHPQDPPARPYENRQEDYNRHGEYARGAGRGAGRDGGAPWRGRGRGGRDGGAGRGAGGRKGGKREQPMGYMALKELEASNNLGEMLQTVVNPMTGFKLLLQSTDTPKPDFISAMLSILARVCEYQGARETLMELMNEIRISTFLKLQLSNYYVTIMTSEKPSDFTQQINNSAKLLQELLIVMPNSAKEVFPTFTILENVVKTNNLSEEVKEQVAKVGDICNEEFIQQRFEEKGNTDRPRDMACDNEDNNPPPNYFRHLTIIPTAEDVKSIEIPFLRANKATGAYQNLEHYLDVQFRLLREDFVRPLRDGITEYLNVVNDGKKAKRLTDVRIYNNVQVLYPVCTPTGISHRIKFDISNLKRIRWQNSKCLIYGSLLCLSCDNFRTLYFAVVANRETEWLEKGEVEVQFVQDINNTPPNQLFVMAETTSYFEASRHVLHALQTIPADLPFQKYLVNADKNIQCPSYLNRNMDMHFDLGCICEDFHVENICNPEISQIDLMEQLDTAEDAASALHVEHLLATGGKLKKVQLLDEKTWPTPEQLQLDRFQFEALRVALTQELAIIQGPPGTGKTYIGLKIVRCLLHNKSFWQTRGHNPILVVCYTNHALDQFLEGILEYCRKDDIVRVGSRSKSAVLSELNLTELRRNIRNKRSVPQAIFFGRRNARKEMYDLERKMVGVTTLIAYTEKGIIHEFNLEHIMPEEHFHSLTSFYVPAEDLFFNFNRPSKLVGWIGLGDYVWINMQGNVEQVRVANDEAAAQMPFQEAEVEVEEEAEIEERRRIVEVEDDRDFEHKRQIRQQIYEDEEEAQRGMAFYIEDIQNQAEAGARQVQNKKNKMQQLRNKLKSTDAMMEEEALGVVDIWTLNVNQRWRLYRYWIALYKADIREGIRAYEEQYQNAANRLKENMKEEDAFIMKNAQVIGMTTTGAAKYRDILQELKPKIVVVEEAAEVLEAHIVTALSSACEHLILIGDHKQLRPKPTVYKLAETYNLKISLFERLIKNGIPHKTLEKQYRMRPEISKFMKHIYPNLIDDTSVLEYDLMKGVGKNVFFLSHNFEESHDDDLKSKDNYHEAKFIPELCHYLMKQGYSKKDITVLTPYSGQVFLLKKNMPKKTFDGIRITAIDNFQGEENEIIIISLVRSQKDTNIATDKAKRQVGFLKEANRICVTLSRAKKGMYVLGNFGLLEKSNDLWKEIINTAKANGMFGDALELYCQNHPEEKHSVKRSKDFDSVPEGGCMKPCESRLECGHACSRVCHTYDQEHKDYRCLKPCGKIMCENKHKCHKQCYKNCGDCTIPMEKCITKCGHIQKVPCSVPDHIFRCQSDCASKLPCGHNCREKCGESHTDKCRVTVPRKLACGHDVKMKCFEEVKKYKCPVKCNVMLDCDHPCAGTCRKCHQGRLHYACQSKCERNLVCNHLCKANCTKDCPPCTEVCRNRCVHSKCTKRCGQPCQQCSEPCAWKCKHYRCTKRCSEVCNRRRCNQPCQLKLKCGHLCIGMCGESCPTLCRVCNEDAEDFQIFFGEEDELDARFVQLGDCRHVIEVNALDKWMDEKDLDKDRKVLIQLKGCPKCKEPIRRNLRYGVKINEVLADIEIVKGKVVGDRVDIKMKCNELKDDCRLKYRTLDHATYKHLCHEEISSVELEMIENKINILSALYKLHEKVKELMLKYVDKNSKLLDKQICEALGWVLLPRQRFSEQEVKEAAVEVERLQIFFNVCQLIITITKKNFQLEEKLKMLLDRYEERLIQKNVLDEKKREQMKKIIVLIKNECPADGLGISEDERVQIVKAMGLSKGHWYKCPNGHVYAIGDCGGATVESTCPECKQTIGGGSHQLRSDNAHAGEMDHSSYAAWSEQANMENYGFDAQF